MRTPLLGLMLVLASIPAWADVVQLTTGDRVEGRFKQATAASVLIEAGGQDIAFPREKVQAIYFGAVRAAQSQSVAHETVQALKAVQSVARLGVSHRAYASRVADAKLQVERYLQEPDGGDADLKKVFVLVIEQYASALSAWNAKTLDRNYLAIGRHPALKECARIERVIAETPPRVALPPQIQATQEIMAIRHGGDYVAGVRVAHLGIPTLWACASDKLDEAERLIKAK
jgi:hypothetical protein